MHVPKPPLYDFGAQTLRKSQIASKIGRVTPSDTRDKRKLFCVIALCISRFIFSYSSYVVVSQSLPRLQTCSTYCSKEPSRTSAFPLAAAEAQHGRCSLAAHSSAAAGRLGSASCCSNSGIELASSLLASNDRALPPLRWHASGPSRLGRLVDRACCPSLALPSMVAGVARRLNGLQ